MVFRAATTVRISGSRFEQSPYYDCYATPNTVLGVAAGRFYPASLGEDEIADYWALRRQAVLYDVPEKPWQIDGPDAAQFLDRVLTRRVGDMVVGGARYVLACTGEGGLFMDGIVFRLGETRFWFVQPDGALEEWFAVHRPGYRVTITDPHSRALQIQGPRSREIMTAATGGTLDASMKYFTAGYYEIGGQVLYVSRTGWTGELGYEIYSNGPDTDHHRLWSDLVDAGKPFQMRVGSLESMRIRRIEAGILDSGSDFDATVTPYEAGLGRFVDLGKPDFLGRSALLEAERDSLFFGIRCKAMTPRRDAEVWLDDQAVGRITTGAWSPELECGIGYVRMFHVDSWIDRILELRLSDGEVAPCQVVGLPFYDREKRIPRG